MTGFEPATPSSQARCATKLRYIPIGVFQQVHDNITLNKIINQALLLNLLYNYNTMTNLLISKEKREKKTPDGKTHVILRKYIVFIKI